MGDRTSVSLTIHADDLDLFKRVISAGGTSVYPDELDHPDSIFPKGDDFLRFYLDDVNYGELSIQEICTKYGIPYEYDWSPGAEYSDGVESLKFKDGKAECVRYDYSQMHLSTKDVFSLLKDAEQDPVPYNYVKDKLLNYARTFTFLPWDNQHAEKAKYRLHQLLKGE